MGRNKTLVNNFMRNLFKTSELTAISGGRAIEAEIDEIADNLEIVDPIGKLANACFSGAVVGTASGLVTLSAANQIYYDPYEPKAKLYTKNIPISIGVGVVTGTTYGIYCAIV